LSSPRPGVPNLHPSTHRSKGAANASASSSLSPLTANQLAQQSKTGAVDMSPSDRAAEAARKAKESLRKQEESLAKGLKFGGLANNSLFADEELDQDQVTTAPARPAERDALVQRSPTNMSHALNPRPNARARWQRRMVIRHIRHGGRLTKEMKIARTERSHLSRSHFFKTSMKKLAPLARQIAGKSIDEAILQMRFSKKKVAQDVRQHLVQARDEAVVMKGMGLGPPVQTEADAPGEATPDVDTPVRLDPAITPPLPHQTPMKTNRPGHAAHETDMYVAEAWTNRGPYGQEPDFRARGRVNIMRPPYTGISVLLKEEKTRTRQKREKDAKEIRRRMGKNMWTQLPDRKITNQRQYVLW